jgi:phosphoribosylanthranilate isomerase
MFPGKKIVLQCGGHALDAVGRSGKDIAEMIKRYNDLIDYVLIDPSGGAGQPFDLNFARECFQHLQAIDHIGFGIAGGLHPGNLHQLHELLKDFPDFSIDAQGKLRDRADNLALEIAMSYRIDAIEIFSKYK